MSCCVRWPELLQVPYNGLTVLAVPSIRFRAPSHIAIIVLTILAGIFLGGLSQTGPSKYTVL